MTDDDRYERYMAGFGRELRHASASRSRRQRFRLPLAVGTGLAALAAAALLLLPPGDGRLDVVAEARAALGRPGEIVHMITTTTVDIPSERGLVPDSCTVPLEQWQAADPLRWRMVQVPSPCNAGMMITADGSAVTGRSESAYADGTQTTYWPEADKVDIVRGLDSRPPRPPQAWFVGDVEPVAEVRRMLAEGELEDRGVSDLPDGRTVRTLTGELRTPDRPGTLEYVVDAESLAPIHATTTSIGPVLDDRSREEHITVRVAFDRYERLPLNDETAGLLTIRPERPAAVTEREADELGPALPQRLDPEVLRRGPGPSATPGE